MSLKIDSISSQNSTPIKTNLTLSPTTADDNELSTLLSGSGSLKTTTEGKKEIGEIPTEKNDCSLSNTCMSTVPGLLGSITSSIFTKNKAFAIAGLVVAGATILTSLLKNKIAAKA